MKKKTFIRIHFLLLLLILINTFLKYGLLFSLNQEIIFYLKILLILSGLRLFILHFKPFKKIAIYFALYWLAPILMIVTWFIDRLLFAIVAAVMLFPVVKEDVKFHQGSYMIYGEFNGFISAYQTYGLSQKKYLIFEQHLGYFKSSHSHHIDWENAALDFIEENVVFKYQEKEFPNENKEIIIDMR